MTDQELWRTVLDELEVALTPTQFKPFFPQTKICQRKGSRLTIGCPNSYIRRRIEQKYQTKIKEIVDRITQKNNQIKFIVRETSKIVKPELSGPLFQKRPAADRGIGISPHYVFDNFVVGNNNNLAHAVAQAVAERPGSAYNPFFLYSGVGLGKTHLIQAIGNAILNKHQNLTVLYCTGESFTNELIDSIQSGSRQNTAKFRNKFRSVDVLLIDDVQFIAGREGTQEEFFHTFNALYMAKKQIVLTSDKPPKEIAKLEERLSSRFTGGIIADMQPPDVDMRVAILRHKAQNLQVDIPNEVLETIAQNVATNIRELEGIFHQVLTLIKTKKLEPMAAATKVLGENLKRQEVEITPREIIKTVSTYYTLKPKDLRGKRRLKEIVRPRQITMYLMRTLTEMPLTEIGALLGGRDHTTVLHGVQKIEQLIKENTQVREQVNVLQSQICG